ncbi:MAG: hypothetical protein WKF43_02535 [Acidimicrobiales bacterium]
MTASLDPRLRQATRDMFVGIAVLDHFSLTDTIDDPHGLIDRALEVADRCEVALCACRACSARRGALPAPIPINGCISCAGL